MSYGGTKKNQCRSDPILRLIVVAATIFGVGLRLRSIFETVEFFLFVSIKLVLKSQENLNLAPEVGWKAKKPSFLPTKIWSLEISPQIRDFF